LQWFEKVNESQLSGNDRDKFNFQKGTFFNSKKKEATTYFNKVVNSQYGSQASIIWALWLMRDDYKEQQNF
jgi:hypothetical protein